MTKLVYALGLLVVVGALVVAGGAEVGHGPIPNDWSGMALVGLTPFTVQFKRIWADGGAIPVWRQVLLLLVRGTGFGSTSTESPRDNHSAPMMALAGKFSVGPQNSGRR